MECSIMSNVDLNPPINDVLINQENFIDYGMQRGFGDIHIKMCPKTGMQAIIAIHSTKLGPALGGCRFVEYASPFAALYDAMRLARGMSHKAAVVGLPLGGGKGVIIKPKGTFDRKAYFESFGTFVNELGGRYITAVDSGSTLEDMAQIHSQTKYVASLENSGPSKYTSLGVLKGLQAAVKHKLGKDSLEGLHVAIQGVGKVGYGLAKLLHELGATLTVSDINPEPCFQAEKEFGANVVENRLIHKVECDVFSPCALGGAINDNTINQLNTNVIAGAANNQLARSYHGHLLHEKGILYAPDYVINAGGLIFASGFYFKNDASVVDNQINNIYESMLNIFERSSVENVPSSVIADTIAKERLS